MQCNKILKDIVMQKATNNNVMHLNNHKVHFSDIILLSA